MREGEAGIVPQRGAEGVFRALKIAYLLQGAAQVAVGLGKVRLQFQCPAVAGDRFVQLPLVLQDNAQVAVCLGKVRLQFQCPAVAGDRFVQLPLVLARQCPGCCAPRQSPASVPVPGGSRRPLRPAFPGSFKALPRLMCASAKSGFSSMPGGSRRPLRPAFPGPSRQLPRL